ncbi:MAG: hypothetical protein II135_10350 [Clostridia bacterium]|nr:hypothetical protein [Clostridia bacterium]
MLDKARIICVYDNSAKNRSEKWVKGKIATTDVRLSENDLTACEIVSKRLGKNYILYVDLSDYGELTKYPAVPLTADRLEKMMNDIQELLNESLPDEEVECLTLFLKNRQPKNENGFIADR